MDIEKVLKLNVSLVMATIRSYVTWDGLVKVCFISLRALKISFFNYRRRFTLFSPGNEPTGPLTVKFSGFDPWR